MRVYNTIHCLIKNAMLFDLKKLGPMHSLRKSIKYISSMHPLPQIKKEQYSEERFWYRINIHNDIYISYKICRISHVGF